MVSPTRFETLGHVLRGVVVDGDKRGRLLGFPTANLCVDVGSALPEHGVYCCRIRVGEDPAIFDATCSVGTNPTFDDVVETRVEVYIHDFDRSIYGERVELLLHSCLRDMVRFSDLDALIKQTKLDVELSRQILRSQPPQIG